eukprot:TRINITY_DN13697_c0_g1_i1.p1 TRINITY_DN13697_c0_g1~~TRINITY_DN13697_c0_g1_i1.p1  ORF type:complete len:268 (+),score=31.73 TRINITY_DN13697_c0_g1_i1:94-897(+)
MRARRLVDTHVHLDMVVKKMKQKNLAEGVREVMEKSNVEGAVHIACDYSGIKTLETVLDSGKAWGVRAAVGLHPCAAKQWNTVRHDIEKWMVRKETVAWGECGLDYHHVKDKQGRSLQQNVLSEQLQRAAHYNKPVVIHARSSEDETLSVMESHLSVNHPIHVHCFTGNPVQAKNFVSAFPNCKIGFTGALTFPSAHTLRETVKALPLDALLTETDGPFMAPVPHRGSTAYPGHVIHIAELIAKLKGESLDSTIEVLRKNVTDVYGF